MSVHKKSLSKEYPASPDHTYVKSTSSTAISTTYLVNVDNYDSGTLKVVANMGSGTFDYTIVIFAASGLDKQERFNPIESVRYNKTLSSATIETFYSSVEYSYYNKLIVTIVGVTGAAATTASFSCYFRHISL